METELIEQSKEQTNEIGPTEVFTKTSASLTQEEILKYFAKKGFLLDKELLKFFCVLGSKEISEEVLTRIFIITKSRIISKSILAENFNLLKPLFAGLDKAKKEFIEDFFKQIMILGDSSKEDGAETYVPLKKETASGKKLEYKVLSSKIIPDKKIEVKDFVTHFKSRYHILKEILKSRKELDNLVSIDKLGKDSNYSIIGIVNSKRVTKNKNLLLEVEDPSGRISALVSLNKPEIFEKTKEIMLDDVIALKCSGGREILFVNDIFFPDAQIEQKRKCSEEIYALFISDIHVGSANFLEDKLQKFIDWLNCKNVSEEQKEKIKKIKYLFITGDNVDGVGIYPAQEERLKIKDIKEQYQNLSEYLKKVPKNITMFMCPGQHDAVRVPEPQPPVDEEFAEPLTKLPNLVLVSNPALIEIGCGGQKEGLKVLMYHGASLHDWINEIEELRLGKTNLNPAKAIKHLLKHRHLSPTHSSTTYVPSEEDSMLIKDIPDIIATGDMHRSDVDIYNNILIVCSSCWQSITPFEEKVGNIPDPGKVPMINLKTREIKILDFN